MSQPKSNDEIINEFENAFVEVHPEEIGSRWKKVNPDRLAVMLRQALAQKDKEVEAYRSYLLRVQGWAEGFEADNKDVDVRWLTTILEEALTPKE